MLDESVKRDKPAYAWPGGYPLYYLCEDAGILCPQCVRTEELVYFDASPDGISDAQWHVIAVDVNWEDESLYCDNCNTKIESAYGE